MALESLHEQFLVHMHRAQGFWAHLPYLTPHKVVNILLNRLEIAARRTTFASLPYVLQLEPAAVCNSTCQLCPVGLGHAKGLRADDARLLSFADYTRILALFERHLLELHLGVWGEPMLNPDIIRMVDHAHQKRIYTTILTNAHLFASKPTLYRELFDAGLDSMLISLHGISAESYNAYQPSKDFVAAMAVVRDICSLNQNLRRRRRISLAFAVTAKNKHELGAFRKLCTELGAEPIDYPASMNVRRFATLEEKRQRIREWSPALCRAEGERGTALEFNYRYYDALMSGMSLDRNFGHPDRCMHMLYQLTVLASGKLLICCGAFPPHGETFESSNLILGDLLAPNANLSRIWNSPVFQQGRAYILRHDMQAAGNHVCTRCVDING